VHVQLAAVTLQLIGERCLVRGRVHTMSEDRHAIVTPNNPKTHHPMDSDGEG
jgi:hypothetical protein